MGAEEKEEAEGEEDPGLLHLGVELSSLLLQLSQSQSQFGAALQLLLPEGLRVLGRVGQQALLLDLEQQQRNQRNQGGH